MRTLVVVIGIGTTMVWAAAVIGVLYMVGLMSEPMIGRASSGLPVIDHRRDRTDGPVRRGRDRA